MTKGRAEAEQGETTTANELGSRRRLKVAQQRPELVLRAFADALRDILHDEPRLTG